MPKANPLKGGWKKAAENFIRSFEGEDTSISVDDLDTLAIVARQRKTEMDRGKTWYEAIRDRIVPTMVKLGIFERFANRRTFYKISPNTEMGKDDAGRKKYDALVARYGQEWADKNVHISKQPVPATVATVYEFIGTGFTQEELEWTMAMGNKPSFEIGDAPKRAKQGKPRRKRT